MSSEANSPGAKSSSGPRLVSAAARSGSAWEDTLALIARGDESAFERLYDESNPLVFGLVLRMVKDRHDAEEITFDVYSQVWAQADRFDRTRSSAAGWLVMIARSRALDHVRSGVFKRRGQSDALSDAAPLVSPNRPADEAVVLKERRKAVNAALGELTEDHRKLLELAFFDGLSHSELASRTGTPLGTVKTRIRAALSKLRASLGGIRGSG